MYLALAARIWWRLPEAGRRSRLGTAYGSSLHRLVLRFQPRTQNHSTFFFRNRPELALLKHLLDGFPQGARLDLAILGCSKGAEVYSFALTIRSHRPDLKLVLSAVDIAQDILDFAQAGVYAIDDENQLDSTAVSEDDIDVNSNTRRDQGSVSIFDRVTDDEMKALFDVAGGHATVKPKFKEGIVWRRGDVASPAFARFLGSQHIVVANRFLCHMKPPAAERCLRSISMLVKPGGYLCVSGVDLDVRTKVAREGGWQPVTELIREVYEGDPSLQSGWPLQPWSAEPYQPQRPDREVRYATAFKLGNR
jgi:chemotaxis methyl-accepting protein methylase